MEDLAAFSRLVSALEPWRGQLVLIGGWAYRLYRMHPLSQKPTYNAVFTRDTDLAFGQKAPLAGDIKAALSDAGFKEQLLGEHRPPVSRYTLGDDDSGFYAEFLTPLEGSGRRRSGEQDATVSKAGITAQKLRHLEVLFVDPWQVRAGKEQGVIVEQPLDIQIPNPPCFLAQKILIHTDRPAAKRAQDILYIHDTLELFVSVLPRLREIWLDRVCPNLVKEEIAAVTQGAAEIFSVVRDTAREASRIPTDRRLSPEDMTVFCREGLKALFSV